MNARNTNKGGARKRLCPLAALAVEAEILCARHLAADNASIRGDDGGAAVMAACDDQKNAIAECASHLTALSATGAAFQLALAACDADVLLACKFADRSEANAIQARMNRLLLAALQYLESIGAELPPTFARYHMGKREQE